MISFQELVQTTTADQLVLSALLYQGVDSRSDTAVIYVHGFLSDFYTWPFVQKMAEKVSKSGIAFLAIQTRGTGIQTEILESSRLTSKYIGSYFELLEEAYLDIDTWVEYLQKLGYKRFILAGHSLGTYKVVRYLFEGSHKEDITKLVLLGPFDKNAYVERKSKGKWLEYVDVAKERISAGKGLEIIPDSYDDFPMTVQTFYSWYHPSEFNDMWDFYRGKNYDYSIWNKISLPIQIVTGSIDESLDYPEFYTREEAYQSMQEHIVNLDLKVIEESTHCFVGHEDEVADVVTAYAQT